MISKRIRDFEISFPKPFADAEERDFGFLFFNKDNPDSYDSNHAVLLKTDKIDCYLEEIKSFYLSKNLTPRIYSSMPLLARQPNKDCAAVADRQLHILKPYLNKHGFIVEDDEVVYMVHSSPSVIQTAKTLEIKRIKSVSSEIIDNIYDEDRHNEGGNAKDRIKKALERGVVNDNFHLLVGFYGGVPVCAATLCYNSGGIARVDNVETGMQFRRKGYSRELIDFLVSYHNKISSKLLYLYSSTPSAIKIYQEAGFEIFRRINYWTAFVKTNHNETYLWE